MITVSSRSQALPALGSPVELNPEFASTGEFTVSFFNQRNEQNLLWPVWSKPSVEKGSAGHPTWFYLSLNRFVSNVVLLTIVIRSFLNRHPKCLFSKRYSIPPFCFPERIAWLCWIYHHPTFSTLQSLIYCLIIIYYWLNKSIINFGWMIMS